MPRAQPLRTGDPLQLGEYALSGRLGEGGQGTVYLGSRGGETYAVKLLHGPVGDEQGVFLREVELAKHVARFCTAQVIDAGFDDGRPYIVSEYVDGPSLQREVALTGPRRGGALERLAVSTATALVAIHRAGIVHRDFKPQNVLLGSDGPRVIDFGLAKALDAAATVSGRGVGTPAYMAPEQITASAVTGAADVFSWGATMCFAANASAPFGQDSVAPVLHRILTAPPELGRLDGRLRTLVESCLDKDARNRPSSRELLFELLGESTGDIPAEVLRSPPPHILRAPPLVPEQRSADVDPDPAHPLAQPEETGTPGSYHLAPPTQDATSEPPAPDPHPLDPGPFAVPGPAGPGEGWQAGEEGASGPDTGPFDAFGSGPRSGPRAFRAEPPGDARDVSAGPPGGAGAFRSGSPGDAVGTAERGVKRWPTAAVAVCVALLVTAGVLVAVLVPQLTRDDPTPVARAAGSSAPSVSESPVSRPATKEPSPSDEPSMTPTRNEEPSPREPSGRPVPRPPVTVAIPELTGLNRNEAARAVRRAGLVLGQVSDVDSHEPIGRVLGSEPASGTMVAQGSMVALRVSAGVPVPEVAGMPRKAAESALAEAGLKAGGVSRTCSERPNGQVISSDPKAGARVSGGSAVALTLSRHGTDVPGVVARSEQDGRAALTAGGFTVRTRPRPVEDESRIGTILSQSVAGGTCARPGAAVVITVGVAPQSGPGPGEEPDPDPTDVTGTPGHLPGG
ncbi:serine/threonine-protein kinase [Nonomuraea maritima]|uniref:serine/threonine-protein kinase n=1 Tax=Nonomuraea maritima TaxID=683260 RepID=UPI00371968CE